jgi:cyclic pyranopterin monophosphate synthase
MRIFRFEEIDESLPLLPLAARRALDVAGRKLSLAGWRRLGAEVRRAISEAGAPATVDVTRVLAALEGIDVEVRPPDDESRLAAAPDETLREVWPRLDPLERFALAHVVARGDRDRVAAAVSEIARPLTHLDEKGAARMVDVGEKPVTLRRARARARVRMAPSTVALIGAAEKGDVLAAARIAGIMAAKRTPELIPLCHGIAITKVEVAFTLEESAVVVDATAEARDRTGVEMEAMVAASVAALTIYDMLKAAERGIAIEEVVLLEKEGGRSGHWHR